MSLFRLSFKHNLLLVVLLISLGFTFMVYLSVSSLEEQSLAAKDESVLGQRGIVLGHLKAEVSAASRLKGAAAEEQLKSLLDEQKTALATLRAEGMTDSAQFEEMLTQWVAARQRALQAAQTIGVDNQQGQRGQVIAALADFESKMFSFMKENFSVLEDSVLSIIEYRSDESFTAYDAAIKQLVAKLEEFGFEEAFADRLTTIKTAVSALIQLSSEQRTAEQQADVQLIKLNRLVEDTQTSVLQEYALARNESEKASQRTRNTLLVAGAIIAISACILLLLVWQRATRSLTGTLHSLEDIASGNLAVRIAVKEEHPDEFDELGAAVNHLADSLGDILVNTRQSSEHLQQMSSQLSHTLDTMVADGERTEHETGTVASAIREISQTVTEMAAASEETNRLSNSAQQATEHGGAVITEALGALEQTSDLFGDLHQQIKGLNESSRQIDGVTDIINGLAEQTNLLALNAAIEAARAGEAGRGFSVVADEVRSLSEETSSATARIDEIITRMQKQLNGIQQSMDQGISQVDQGKQQGAGAIQEMQQIRRLFSDVSDRNQQQSVSIEQISATAQSIAGSMDTVLTNISKASDKNKEIDQFSGNVVQQAEQLLQTTSAFRV